MNALVFSKCNAMRGKRASTMHAYHSLQAISAGRRHASGAQSALNAIFDWDMSCQIWQSCTDGERMSRKQSHRWQKMWLGQRSSVRTLYTKLHVCMVTSAMHACVADRSCHTQFESMHAVFAHSSETKKVTLTTHDVSQIKSSLLARAKDSRFYSFHNSSHVHGEYQ